MIALALGSHTRVVNCREEPFDVLIGRPSIWSNKFSSKPSAHPIVLVASKEEAVRRYEEWLRSRPVLMAKIKLLLKGKRLGCFCTSSPCHGEVLARIADEE